MKPAYRVFNVDLTAATVTRLTDAGQNVSSVTIQVLPAGVTPLLVLGQNSEGIPLTFSGQTWKIECPALDEGVFINNPVAAPGSVLTLIVSFDNSLTANIGGA